MYVRIPHNNATRLLQDKTLRNDSLIYFQGYSFNNTGYRVMSLRAERGNLMGFRLQEEVFV